MKIGKYILLVPILFTITIQATNIKNYNQAIDIAGKQRALSFKMAMYKAMIGSHLIYKNPSNRLKKSQKSFEEAQKALKIFAKDKAISNALLQVDNDYINMKKILSRNISKKDISKLIDIAVKQKNDANKVVKLLVKKSGIQSSEKIDYAGYLRALSQKIALNYVLYSWIGDNTDMGGKIHKQLSKTIKEMGGIIKKLSLYNDNTKDEQDMILKLKKDYLYFDIIIKSNIATPVMILKKSDNIFSNADKLVKLYKHSIK